MQDDASSADRIKKQKRQTNMKTKLVLLMYDALLCGGSVLRDDFCKEYKISERTFYRYLLAVSKFFAAYKPNYYIRKDGAGVYYLKGY